MRTMDKTIQRPRPPIFRRAALAALLFAAVMLSSCGQNEEAAQRLGQTLTQSSVVCCETALRALGEAHEKSQLARARRVFESAGLAAKTDDNVTELSGFATEALDANGETTFDFNDVSDAVLISTSQGVTGNLLSAGAKVYDYNVNNTNRNLYIWDNTYVAVNRDGKTNSFGWDEGYNMFTVGSAGWSGLGFNIRNENLSMIDDGWWFHFAMKGDDQELHTSHQITVSNANFIIGNSDGKFASTDSLRGDDVLLRHSRQGPATVCHPPVQGQRCSLRR